MPRFFASPCVGFRRLRFLEAHHLRVILFIIFFCGSLFVRASESCAPSEQDCVEVGQLRFSLGLGVGVRTNPLIDSDDIPIVLIPGISYYGERFFVSNTTAGYTFFEDARNSVSAVGTISFDQVFFDRWDVGNFLIDPSATSSSLGTIGGGEASSSELGEDQPPILDVDQLDDRELGVFAGLEYAYYFNRWALSTQILHDIRSIHDGIELRTALSRDFSYEAHRFEFATGLVWQSAEIVDYYYGLSANEVPSERFVYEASSDVTPFFKANWKWRLNKKWHIQFTLHHRWFEDEITNSPLVEESSTSTIFFGGVYHF